jgi:phosphoadenosine phosphosulfate reductase
MNLLGKVKNLVGASSIKEDKNFVEKASIDEKIEKSKRVIEEAFKRFPHDKIALAWTGGKDSTILLWMARELAKEKGLPLPHIMFINEGYVFEEVTEFCDKLSKDWNFPYHIAQNDDVLKQVKKVGDPVKVSKLNARNKKALKALDFKGKTFPFEPESYVGNHLMKTVAMNIHLEKEGIQALITGIRWDEQEARTNETYFSPRKNPNHFRVHPILHLKERDVWEAHHKNKIPYVKLYEEGYRSLGAKGTTTKASDKPAWEQDLENTTEREGRRQDKEKIMKRLRDLGYM